MKSGKRNGGVQVGGLSHRYVGGGPETHRTWRSDLQEKRQACGGAQGLPRVLRARWMPKINTWMAMSW